MLISTLISFFVRPKIHFHDASISIPPCWVGVMVGELRYILTIYIPINKAEI